ncbi:MAG TPA: hypothetical protein VLG14_08540 [Sphingomonas sp.]|jgi:hypothetical protein|nr:hypothetical protein [Sphingomonas sp.]
MLIPVLASVLLTAQAAQLDPSIEADVACVASFSYLTSTLPKERQAEMAPLITYYVGRIDGKQPGVDLQAAILRQVAGKSGADLNSYVQSNTKRCGAEMVQMGNRLQAVGKALTDSGM